MINISQDFKDKAGTRRRRLKGDRRVEGWDGWQSVEYGQWTLAYRITRIFRRSTGQTVGY